MGYLPIEVLAAAPLLFFVGAVVAEWGVEGEGLWGLVAGLTWFAALCCAWAGVGLLCAYGI